MIYDIERYAGSCEEPLLEGYSKCRNKWFSEIDERKREELHDDILKEWGMKKYEKYRLVKVSSEYDYRSNISSINIVYL